MIFARFFCISDLLEMEREHDFAIVILTKIQWTAYRVYINKTVLLKLRPCLLGEGKGLLITFS